MEDWPRGMGMVELGGGGLQSFWHDVSGRGGALGGLVPPGEETSFYG